MRLIAKGNQMAIRVKAAGTAKELADIYKLRHKVYVEGEGYFKDHPGDHIVDQFDTVPEVINVIAYRGDVAIGTIRLNKDSDIGLPCDEIYDFSEYRKKQQAIARAEGLPEPVFCSGGMLAIAEEWRNRRDLFQALFRMTLDVGGQWGGTHVLLTVNVKSASIYKRLGFEIISEEIWSTAIGEHIVAMVSPFQPVYDWAFGSFSDKKELLDSFAGCFQVYLADAGTDICVEGEEGHEAFLISKGLVNITRTDNEINEKLHLATLGEGEMFGELALIDDLTRSATVTAKSNVELMVLSRETFWQKLHQDPEYLKSLLNVLTRRIRDADQRAYVYAHGDSQTRLKFFLNKIMETSIPSIKSPGHWLVRITLEEFAYMAKTPEPQTSAFLTALEQEGKVILSSKSITFIGKQTI